MTDTKTMFSNRSREDQIYLYEFFQKQSHEAYTAICILRKIQHLISVLVGNDLPADNSEIKEISIINIGEFKVVEYDQYEALVKTLDYYSKKKDLIPPELFNNIKNLVKFEVDCFQKSKIIFLEDERINAE